MLVAVFGILQSSGVRPAMSRVVEVLRELVDMGVVADVDEDGVLDNIGIGQYLVVLGKRHVPSTCWAQG